MPLGADVSAGAPGLARRLLSGEDLNHQVVPPFGLLAVEGSRRFVLQQDWLGMSRLYTATADGVTGFCTRPSLLAQVLGLPLAPDADGWASYTATGHFGGDLSPVREVRLLAPGARLTGRRTAGGGWALAAEQRRTLDDVIADGLALRGRSPDEALDLAAQGITAALRDALDVSVTEPVLGLSGGKDSRIIAAAFVAAGRLPTFSTNVDVRAEGDTAAHLLQLLRDKRGLGPVHKTYRAGAPAAVLTTGLHDRVERLQRKFDFQSSSTYVVRPAPSALLPEKARPLSFAGTGGELATGYWYPKSGDDADEALARETALTSLMSGVDAPVAAPEPFAAERRRLDGLLDHGRSLGLRGAEVCDHLYLVERVRRWYSSGYVTGIITPFLAPDFVLATYALPPAAKRARAVHNGLLQRYVPEWVDVPYVSVSTGRSTATRVWEGDGLRVLADLLDSHDSSLTRLLERDQVKAALLAAAAGRATKRQERSLQHFAWLAVASEALEPSSVAESDGTTYREARAAQRSAAAAAATSPAPPQSRQVPASVTAVAAPLRFLKRTRLGGRAWAAARRRVVAARKARSARR